MTSEKLMGAKNYLFWADSVELWFMGQGYEDHLTKSVDDVRAADKTTWKKIDAQLCNLMWQTIDPPKLTMFRAYKTCKKVWDHAKALYTNDIARLYHVAKKLCSLQLQGTDMESYVGAVEAVKEEFSTLLPYVSNANDHHAQQEKLFLVLMLLGLPAELESLRQQILGTSLVPSLEDVFAQLLQSGPSLETHNFDQTALASQSSSQVSFQVPTRGGRGGRGNGRGNRTRLNCTYCHRIGHTQDKCYALHDRPTKIANVVQTNEPSNVHSAAQPQGIFVSGNDYDEFLKIEGRDRRLVQDHPFCLTCPPKAFYISRLALIPPQQNGVAERKHRHLIETARTLLLHTHVPLKFWGQAVLTACKDKLTSRSIKCVFLGYTRFQKGYRCYSPALNRFFMSADVTFLENTPFFSAPDLTSPSITEVLPVPYLDGPPIPTKPLQVYHRRPRPAVQDNSSPEPVVEPSLDPSSGVSSNPPIALKQGTHSTHNPNPIYNFLSYHRLSSSHYAFTSSLSSVSIPKTTAEALSHPGWRQAMIKEMSALHSTGTWDLVPLPPGKSTVGCRWIYTIKVGSDGTID
ncbi:uncharacterized protein [Arachis hypogaea]|uniref:uncharacterized protein n=1 Tax=Arachis hypogaea TaxID=3818 RepID=UPI003B218CAB